MRRPSSRDGGPLETAGLILSGACCALLGVLALLDVVFRTLDLKFFVATDTGGFLMGWLIFFALPVITRSDAHIRVTVLVGLLPNRARLAVDLLSQIAVLAYMAALIALCSQITYDAWANQIRAQGILRIPTFYPFLGMMIGFACALVSQAMVVAERFAGLRPQA